jgi:hypothetical protein
MANPFKRTDSSNISPSSGVHENKSLINDAFLVKINSHTHSRIESMVRDLMSIHFDLYAPSYNAKHVRSDLPGPLPHTLGRAQLKHLADPREFYFVHHTLNGLIYFLVAMVVPPPLYIHVQM